MHCHVTQLILLVTGHWDEYRTRLSPHSEAARLLGAGPWSSVGRGGGTQYFWQQPALLGWKAVRCWEQTAAWSSSS